METENPKITHIERIEIKGLWGKYDIDWQLHPDVNILVGINGSGKSTILELLMMILDDDENKKDFFLILSFNRIVCYFDNAKFIELNPIGGDFNTIERMSKENKHYEEFRDEINQNITNQKKQSSFYLSYVKVGNFNIREGKKFIVKKIINSQFIKTFDNIFQPLEAIQKLSNERVITFLDWEIHNLIVEYKGFQSKILNRYRKEKQEEIFEKDNLFRNLINQLFSKTEKTILINDESDINFQVRDMKISPYELSSGEKQMLIILLKVLIQDNQPYILLMDEPEISLHLSWQVDLIDNIRKLNENCQIIIATHSPSIIQKGWNDKVALMTLHEESEKGIMYLTQKTEITNVDMGRAQQ